MLPNIDTIYVDVSYGGITNGWERYKTINVTDNYNVTDYKNLTFTKKETVPSGNANVSSVLAETPLVNFDVRIYGENSAYNYPAIEDRSLLY